MRRFRRRAGLALGLTLIGAMLVARPCLVAGTSMEPALHGDDVIVVARSWTRPWPVAREEIVVIRLTRGNLLAPLGQGSGVAIVKRIVAAPGDVVEAREDDGVFVNGVRLPDVTPPFSAKIVDGRFYRYRRGSDIFEVTANGELTPVPSGQWPRIERVASDPLPPGAFFALGDNAATSFDSLRFGPVHADEIEGIALAIVWPFDRWGKLPSCLRRPCSTS